MNFSIQNVFVFQGTPQNVDPPAKWRTGSLMRREFLAPTKSWQLKNLVSCEVSEVLMLGIGLICKTVLGSPVSIRTEEGSSGLRWVLGSAGPIGCLFSGSSLIGFLLSRGEWAGFVFEPRRGSCSLEHVGAVSLSRLRGCWCVGS